MGGGTEWAHTTSSVTSITEPPPFKHSTCLHTLHTLHTCAALHCGDSGPALTACLHTQVKAAAAAGVVVFPAPPPSTKAANRSNQPAATTPAGPYWFRSAARLSALK